MMQVEYLPRQLSGRKRRAAATPQIRHHCNAQLWRGPTKTMQRRFAWNAQKSIFLPILRCDSQKN